MMRRGQGKSIFNNRKHNMTPPESRIHTPARLKHRNADESDLKNTFRKMLEDLKEDMRKSLKEIEIENPLKKPKLQVINKFFKEAVQDLKAEIETIKKAQYVGMLKIEKLGHVSVKTSKVLTPLLITSPSVQPDSRTSAQSLLPSANGEGSRMAYKLIHRKIKNTKNTIRIILSKTFQIAI
ncbi:putative transposase [Cricetulus griseus]|nr:putative transposase [Cricetulus griseus]